MHNPKSYGATLLLSADRNIFLTDKDAMLEKLTEHFNSVFNPLSSIIDNAINRQPQLEVDALHDKDLNRHGAK